MRVAGLISGTSVDGIDVAIVDINDRSLSVVAHDTVPYPPDVREAILTVSNAKTHTGQIARLNFLVGELFAQALIRTCSAKHVPVHSIDLIGSHGAGLEEIALRYLRASVPSSSRTEGAAS